jgi:hypothetical protein
MDTPRNTADLKRAIGALKHNPKGDAANNPVCQALLAPDALICGRALVLFVSHETADSLPSSLLPPLL